MLKLVSKILVLGIPIQICKKKSKEWSFPSYGTAIFGGFLLIYLSFRFDESAGDSGNIVWMLNNAIADDQPALFTPRHWLPSYFFQHWIYLLDYLSIGRVDLASSTASEFATSLNRIAILNSILGSATLAFTYFFSRRLGANSFESFISTCIFGFATTTWLLATSGEWQISGLFFMALGFCLMTYLSHQKTICYILYSSATATLFCLAFLTYLPLLMFSPVILALCIFSVFRVDGGHPNRYWRIGILFLCFIVSSAFLTILFDISILQTLACVKSCLWRTGFDFGFFPKNLNLPIIVNNILALSGYFSGWIWATDRHTISISNFLANPHGFGFFSFLLSSLFVIIIFLFAFRVLLNIKRLLSYKENYPQPIYQIAFAAYVTIGTIIVLGTREGHATEFWSLVLWGAVPLVSLELTRFLKPFKTFSVTALAVILITVNIWTGVSQFQLDLPDRNRSAIAFLTLSEKIDNQSTQNDIFLIHMLSQYYWLPITSNHNIRTVVVDSIEPTSLKILMENTLKNKGRIFILGEILSHNSLTDKRLLEKHTDEFKKNLYYLTEEYVPSGFLLSYGGKSLFYELTSRPMQR